MDAPARLMLADASGPASATVELMRAAGHFVQHVRDGRAALEIAQSPELAVAVVDLDLPGLDGWEVLAAIRAQPQLVPTPVVLLSAQASRAAKLRALREGAEDLLPNPPDLEELLGRVERCLEGRRQMLRMARQLRQDSVVDALTQLFGPHFFQSRMEEEFRRAQRYDQPLALILVDLDQFRSVNERFGRPIGDQVLQGVASARRTAVRQTDFVSRLGGEEFALLLPQTHLTGSLTVAERIARQLALVRVGPAGVVRITASLGVAGFPGRSVISVEQMHKAAAAALRRAQQEGNRIVLHPHLPSSAEPDPKVG